MCKLKRDGGLKLHKIFLRSRALLGNWLWSFPWENNASKHRIIVSIYWLHSNCWDANIMVRWLHHCPWKTIGQAFIDFSNITCFSLGDGMKNCFWEHI